MFRVCKFNPAVKESIKKTLDESTVRHAIGGLSGQTSPSRRSAGFKTATQIKGPKKPNLHRDSTRNLPNNLTFHKEREVCNLSRLPQHNDSAAERTNLVAGKEKFIKRRQLGLLRAPFLQSKTIDSSTVFSVPQTPLLSSHETSHLQEHSADKKQRKRPKQAYPIFSYKNAPIFRSQTSADDRRKHLGRLASASERKQQEHALLGFRQTVPSSESKKKKQSPSLSPGRSKRGYSTKSEAISGRLNSSTSCSVVGKKLACQETKNFGVVKLDLTAPSQIPSVSGRLKRSGLSHQLVDFSTPNNQSSSLQLSTGGNGMFNLNTSSSQQVNEVSTLIQQLKHFAEGDQPQTSSVLGYAHHGFKTIKKQSGPQLATSDNQIESQYQSVMNKAAQLAELWNL